jgi:uncharacterized protein YndB with AHSA1/START domain
MSTTKVNRRVKASRARVYQALLDQVAVQQWMVPTGMTSQVHRFEPWEGGTFRISLTYDAASDTGKTTSQTDTYHGHFVKLVQDELLVEKVEFETDNPAIQGEMTITIALIEVDGQTEVQATHDDLPAGVKESDNELGWTMSLGKLAELVESGASAQA